MRESEKAAVRQQRAEQRRQRRIQREAATERDLIRAYKHTQRLTPDSEWEAERTRPGLVVGSHPCIECKLTLIPDTKAAVLCQFCWRTKILVRAK